MSDTTPSPSTPITLSVRFCRSLGVGVAAAALIVGVLALG